MSGQDCALPLNGSAVRGGSSSHGLDTPSNLPANPFKQKRSSAEYDWDLMKQHGETSKSLDELMQYQGLEEVKKLFLDIKSTVNVYKKQDEKKKMNTLKLDRFSIIFQGNSGTGKTTVARLYAKFLFEEGILGSAKSKETSGVKAALEGAKGMEKIIKDLIEDGGGVLFVDEAYQLMASYMNSQGKEALDMILSELENNIGNLAAIFVGYKDQMQPFFEHNPGLESRIPYVVTFNDFDDSQLWHILAAKIHKHYQGQMRVEKGMDGLYMRIAIRRLAQARGSRGFGNARAVENLLARIRKRQAHRLAKKKKEMWENEESCHEELDYFLFTKEDIIGPNPSRMAKCCPAWIKLNNLVGLEEVKNSAKQLIGMVELNYHRELLEQPPVKFSLNQIFIGNPGTGKTTVAKLYSEIFSYLGYLSYGDIVLKTPPDFIGSSLGESETKTRKILQSTIGKVLVIDEAYMLDAGDPEKSQNKFKSGIIDTIVSMVQGVPGEDRCIILIGYKNEIRTMFQNVNPGLSRRFPIEHPFHFTDFTVNQLEKILRIKMAEDGLKARTAAILVARQLFTRALMRPKFTNAGEVNSILAAAKMNYETRLSYLPLNKRLSTVKLEAIDFDPNVGRMESFELNYEKMITILDRRIVDRLVSYQRSYRDVAKQNLDPRKFVPTNFIFKGPSGTGKMTTARQMGQLFYDMGFLSTKDVIEYSMIDFVAQYIGQTRPKTRKSLQQGLGGVLIIKNADQFIQGSYRNSFTTEALEELLQFLANPDNTGKMVFILSGLVDEMNKLMVQVPKLASHFPEEIIFEGIPPDDGIRILVHELKGLGISIAANFLTDTSTKDYREIKDLLYSLSLLPGWNNARDIQNLAKKIGTRYLQYIPIDQSEFRQELQAHHVTECLDEAIAQRKRRPLTSVSSGPSPCSPTPDQKVLPQDTAASESATAINIYINEKEQKAQNSSKEAETPRTDSPETGKEPHPALNEDHVTREDGVSDSVWERLNKDKDEASYQRHLQEKHVPALKRQLKDAELMKNEVRIETLQKRLTQVQEKILKEEKIQKTLRAMSPCVKGYTWIRQEGGYRCKGGFHFVSDKELPGLV